MATFDNKQCYIAPTSCCELIIMISRPTAHLIRQLVLSYPLPRISMRQYDSAPKGRIQHPNTTSHHILATIIPSVHKALSLAHAREAVRPQPGPKHLRASNGIRCLEVLALMSAARVVVAVTVG